MNEEDQDDEALKLALQRRDELLRDEKWLTAAEVHERLGGSSGAPDAHSRVSRLRQAGELLGVWDGSRFLFPLFQFYPDSEGGRLIPTMKDLLAMLPNNEEDKSGWRRAFWLFQCHASIKDGGRPADALRTDPRAVLRAAHSTFSQSDEYW